MNMERKCIQMRKIILNLAVSLDGYISDDDGGFDWIVGQGDRESDLGEPFDFPAFMSSVDTVVMGSKAYEDCILSGLQTFDNQKVIVATNRNLAVENDAVFISGDICKQVLEMREKDGKDIWLFGGAGVADPFLKADVIDEYIIGIIPTLLGHGRRLFNGGFSKIDLKLEASSVEDGVVMLRYSKR